LFVLCVVDDGLCIKIYQVKAAKWWSIFFFIFCYSWEKQITTATVAVLLLMKLWKWEENVCQQHRASIWWRTHAYSTSNAFLFFYLFLTRCDHLSFSWILYSLNFFDEISRRATSKQLNKYWFEFHQKFSCFEFFLLLLFREELSYVKIRELR
jgi:hypothetical protein